MKDVVDGAVVSRLLPASGKVAEDLAKTAPAIIVQDPRVELCRAANPDSGGM